MISIIMTILPQIFADGLFSFLAFFNAIYGASKTQELIVKARSQLNIKDPLQAEKQLLNHF